MLSSQEESSDNAESPPTSFSAQRDSANKLPVIGPSLPTALYKQTVLPPPVPPPAPPVIESVSESTIVEQSNKQLEVNTAPQVTVNLSGAPPKESESEYEESTMKVHLFAYTKCIYTCV